MSAPGTHELTRMIKPRALPPAAITVEATAEERAALAQRFGVTAVHALNAQVDFGAAEGAVLANGTLTASIEQPCAITSENFTYSVTEPLTLRFVPAAALPQYAPDEEVELSAEELDEIPYDGEMFDLGEAIAQTLALAIDPYREGPVADAVRKAGLVSSEEDSGPFAALSALKRDDTAT
ncbi:YceD family protein [Qipengyuania marisflavi]|uniref:DUF177 domain-containing protein n=1 Tax=Qipengyuania marisflavi TaxID=2486356 RepID=A0A5S3NY78_9SPHN|nr:DUF177 domain-containing protein [Qipengyuania marisflavi]TMM45331.1 DUF177 domain-containing protein [Qipengyuania marisflavi]